MRRTLFAFIALTGVLMNAAPSAAADDDPRKAQAEPILREGKRLHDQGRLDEALVKLRQTYAIYPSPNVLTLLALVEQKVGHPLDAIGHYREALRNGVIHPENEEMAKRGVAELEQKLARLNIRGPRGLFVTINRNEYALPLKDAIDIEPGTIAASGKLAETSYRGTVVASAGKVAVLDMKPEVAILSPPVEPPHEPDAVTRWGTGQYIGVGLVGAGLVGLAAGGGFTIAKSSASDDVRAHEELAGSNERCGQSGAPRGCSELQSARDDRDLYGGLSTGFFIGGAAAIVGGAVMFFVWPKKTAPISGMTVIPRIGLRSVDLELRF